MLRTFALFSIVLAAAHAESWNVVQALRPGDRVRIEDSSRVEHKGEVAGVTADSLSLRNGKTELSIPRAEVRRVKVKASTRRVRNLAIGAGVGLAIGLVVDNTLGQYIRNEANNVNRAWYYVIPIGLFGGVGAAMSPYRTIYKAP